MRAKNIKYFLIITFNAEKIIWDLSTNLANKIEWFNYNIDIKKNIKILLAYVSLRTVYSKYKDTILQTQKCSSFNVEELVPN